MVCGACWKLINARNTKSVGPTQLLIESALTDAESADVDAYRESTAPQTQANNYSHPALHRSDPARVADVEARLKTVLDDKADLTKLDLSSLDLFSLPPDIFARASLVKLNLSRNCIVELPAEIALFTALVVLDVSRNRLKVVPEGIGQLHSLRELNLMTNHMRPLERAIPLSALSSLSNLEHLDVRFNPKLSASAALADVLAAHTPSGCTILHGDLPTAPQQTAGERDATLLRCQLEPWSTPALRRRLEVEFGVSTHPDDTDREVVLQLLLKEYAAVGPRAVRKVSGIAPPTGSAPLLIQLLDALRGTVWPEGLKRERQTIRAQGYIILQRPVSQYEDGQAGSATDVRGSTVISVGSRKAKAAEGKLQKHSKIWDLAYALMRSVDPDFAEKYTAVAMTKQFVGSPHVDTENVGPFYGLSLGDFEGGCICVESGPFEVAEMDTHNKFGKIDGRFPHWVSPHTGERYSVVYYQTAGLEVPKTTAVFW